MIRALLLAVALAARSPALAQSPVQVTSDEFVVDQQANEATFTGNVVITRPDLKVWAERVHVTFGAGGMNDIKTITATGRVRLKTDDQDATGDRATFTPDSQIPPPGNVTVINATGTLNGPSLVIDLANNVTTFSAKGGGRVTGVFSP